MRGAVLAARFRRGGAKRRWNGLEARPSQARLGFGGGGRAMRAW